MDPNKAAVANESTRMIGVTGATGFVGQALCNHLQESGHPVRRMIRQSRGVGAQGHVVGDIGPDTDWSDALRGLDVVVHCAAAVHQASASPASDIYRRINTEGTLRLAQCAAQAGVRRLVFVSTIKVMGESSPIGQPLTSTPSGLMPMPAEGYARSKWAAEEGLWRLAEDGKLEVVVVRPPLVYGPQVRANFRQLMHWVARGLPLPLGGVRNRRSLVALPNLLSLLSVCMDHPAAAGQTFLVSDGHDLSTPELIRALAKAMGRPARLFSVPPSLLQAAARLAGRGEQMSRLTQSLQVDIEHTRRVLGWSPVCTVEEGLRLATQDFLAT